MPVETFETTIGSPPTPVQITVRGTEVVMSHAHRARTTWTTLVGPMQLGELSHDGWFWTEPTTRRAFESVGFTFPSPQEAL